MNRKLTKIEHMSGHKNDDYVPGSIASRLNLVWPLTRETASLSKHYNVEQRLQRNVAVLSRRKG